MVIPNLWSDGTRKFSVVVLKSGWNSVLFYQIQYCCIKFSIVLSNSALFYQIQYCCIKFSIVLSNSALFYQIQYCSIKFSIVSNSVLLYQIQYCIKYNFDTILNLIEQYWIWYNTEFDRTILNLIEQYWICYNTERVNKN
jgi:hypothetical protein